MVIIYSAEELVAIGEIVTLKECLARANSQEQQNKRQKKLNLSFIPEAHDNPMDPFTFGPLKWVQMHHITKNTTNEQQSDNHLTLPVAEFFEKAQQNFLTTISIDATKVRRLSEIEAELVSPREIW